MELFAITVPILPGKTDQWRRFVSELAGPRRREYEDSRRRLGVWERAFLQQTPAGDMVIVTMEGQNPRETFLHMADSSDEFTQWFRQQVKEIHGFDLAQPPSWPMPELRLDSGGFRGQTPGQPGAQADWQTG